SALLLTTRCVFEVRFDRGGHFFCRTKRAVHTTGLDIRVGLCEPSIDASPLPRSVLGRFDRLRPDSDHAFRSVYFQLLPASEASLSASGRWNDQRELIVVLNRDRHAFKRKSHAA